MLLTRTEKDSTVSRVKQERATKENEKPELVEQTLIDVDVSPELTSN